MPPIKKKPPKKKSSGSPAPLRYAHPFFTTTEPAHRLFVKGVGQRMTDFALAQLGPIPKPKGNSAMNLADFIGVAAVQQIQAHGSISFHVTGDTGRQSGDPGPQEQVAEAMTADYVAGQDSSNPALFLHLGDVIYGPGKDLLYRDEFYRPYLKYPGKIVAIPGNHDGETFTGTDPTPLKAFLANFCAASAVVPPIASGAGIFRQTMTQPGVYWWLNAPFVDVIGLYSNIAEGPGDLTGAGGDTQQTVWLQKTLTAIKASRQGSARRALVIATHHPPFSEGGHSSSDVMLGQIDAVCKASGIWPDAHLSGHAHNYQRYTRTVATPQGTAQILYIVVGCGGHAASSVKAATGQAVGDAVFQKSLSAFGYLTLTASASQAQFRMSSVSGTAKTNFDTVTVDLTARHVK